MSSSPLLVPLLGLLLSLPAVRAQGDQEMKQLACRVTSSGQGKAILIDRGLRDGLQKGDTLVLRPRQGGVLNARVSSVSSRSAAVTILGSRVIPPPGTRGEIQIPKSRFTGKAGTGKTDKKTIQTPPPPAKVPDKTDPGKAAPETGEPRKNPAKAVPDWRNKDKDYRTGMPLLTGMRPRRPSEREMRVTGLAYLFADLTLDQADADNSVFRVGTDLTVENFLHYGDLHFNGEINYATAYDDTQNMDLLVRGLSYVMGGNRFDKHRLEVGRFLQNGIPEFQYLDGVEWGYRFDNSSRVGASFGFMPEPDADFQSMTDSQIAVYYEWVNGLAEIMSLTAAYQKTFNKGTADRDLFLAKLRYSPKDAWNVNGTVWVDLYDGRDQTRQNALEVTEAWLSFNRLWEDGSGMDFTYRHSTFPEIVRKEWTPPFPPTEIVLSKYDRLTWRGWSVYRDGGRLHARMTGWVDQEGGGWSVDTGREWRDWFQTASRTDISFYGGSAATVNTMGGRIHYSVPSASGTWNWYYDLSLRHNKDIADDRDEWLQHRLRASHDFKIFGDWESHIYTEARLWDTEFSWSVGIFLQRSF